MHSAFQELSLSDPVSFEPGPFTSSYDATQSMGVFSLCIVVRSAAEHVPCSLTLRPTLIFTFHQSSQIEMFKN